ncbi:pimeloyl-ACP methyl ester carboxylesterase [Haloactinopolyspora alba]|uniref:Pimeloyl-ACP methyl ester carboxylesterase n=1 Tax=Haloactinopolyspora alba TaxID=648780 RepID=A0A2P8E8V5_9ACTN|nr:alpha/beta hydrolase [Haloactinopolyspora alba]PSL05899.1 pimeloyl-ACP methyl ester carboxylesterase [Haloactinopolyspora alba]
MPTSYTPSGVAYDRAGPPGDLPVVLIHAGVADRRMWDSVWPSLTAEHDTVRLDLRGFGASTRRPQAALSPVGDVIDTLAVLGVERCHLIGASVGAGVAVETALVRPELVESLLLSAPGGTLIADVTPDLREFAEAEDAALARGDLEGAVEANVATWAVGPGRNADDVHPTLCEQVRRMQRLAFENTAEWDDVQEDEIEPPALERLTHVTVPTLVLVGELDLVAIHDAAGRVVDAVPGARRVDWPDTAHLPSMERPADFVALLREWLPSAMSRADGGGAA